MLIPRVYEIVIPQKELCGTVNLIYIRGSEGSVFQNPTALLQRACISSWCYPKLWWPRCKGDIIYEETSSLVFTYVRNYKGGTWIVKALQLSLLHIHSRPKNHQILQKQSAQECARRPKTCARKPKKCARTRKNTQENFWIHTPSNWFEDVVYTMVLLS